MFEHLSNNLNILMAQARINSNELARQINVPATTIKRIRTNGQSNPTITTLLPIAQYFSITLDQLIGKDKLLPNSLNLGTTIQKIPLLSWHECIQFTSSTHNKKPLGYIQTERKVSTQSFALTVEDDDLDLFTKGSILIIEPAQLPEAGDYIIVGDHYQRFASIRKYIIEIDRIYLKPLMKGVPLSTLSPDYKILGVIIQSKIELKMEAR